MTDLLFDIGTPIASAVCEEVQDEPKKKCVFDLWKPLPFPPLTGAAFSPCRKFRYALWRRWMDKGDTALFLLLNPSTADEIKNDPTVERCERYAKSWGYARLFVANLFAFRATFPKDLKWADDPIGPHNDKWILKLARMSTIVIAGWGNHGGFMQREKRVKELLLNDGSDFDSRKDIYCLAVNKGGSPKHPLYMKNDLKPIPYEGFFHNKAEI